LRQKARSQGKIEARSGRINRETSDQRTRGRQIGCHQETEGRT
jgi:hypothetical protein